MFGLNRWADNRWDNTQLVCQNYIIPPPPSTGTTIVVNATKDGVPWDSPPFAINVSVPGCTNCAATIDPPLSGPSPAGTYTFNSVTPPSVSPAVTFSSVTPSATQTLPDGGTITFTINFVTTPPSSGTTIVVNATKDGVPWDSPAFAVNVSVPGCTNCNTTIDPPLSGPSPAGTYTFNSVTPPAVTPAVTFSSITPSATQTLPDGGTITFTINFVVPWADSVPTLVITPSSASVQVGGTQQYDAIYDPDGAGPLSPSVVTGSSSWTTSDRWIATVIDMGVFAGVAAGSATITTQHSGLTASASLTVTTPVPTLVLTPSSASVPIGGTQQFTAIYDPDGSGPNPPQNVTVSAAWASSDATKVTVSGGLATRVDYGYTSISALYAGLTAFAIVLGPLPPPLSVSCSVSPTSATVGQSVTWTAIASGGTGSYSYSWSGDSLNGQTGNPVTVSYATTGTKTGSVQVTSGSQVVSQPCATSVTIGMLPSLPLATLLVNGAATATIDKGQSATLTWTSTNATSCTAMGGFSTGGATSGSASVSPPATSNYQINCTGPGGTVNSNIVTITVISATVSISAAPTCISGGGSTKISWSATPIAQIISCSVSGPGLSSTLLSGSKTVTVTAKSTYTIDCVTRGGSDKKSVVVDVSSCWSEF